MKRLLIGPAAMLVIVGGGATAGYLLATRDLQSSVAVSPGAAQQAPLPNGPPTFASRSISAPASIPVASGIVSSQSSPFPAKQSAHLQAANRIPYFGTSRADDVSTGSPGARPYVPIATGAALPRSIQPTDSEFSSGSGSAASTSAFSTSSRSFSGVAAPAYSDGASDGSPSEASRNSLPTARNEGPGLIPGEPVSVNPQGAGNTFIADGQRVAVETYTVSPEVGDPILDLTITPAQGARPASPTTAAKAKGSGWTYEEELFRLKWGWNAFNEAARAASGQATGTNP